MKIFFFMQRRFAYVAHAMAMVFKERYGIKDFCGFVSTRDSFNFLTSQKDIDYSELLLEEDIYARHKHEKIDLDFLEFLKKEYGLPNLWPYLMLDRIIMQGRLIRAYPFDRSQYTHEEMQKMLQATARAIISFLEKEKPTVIIFSVISNLSLLLFYHIAKKKGVQTLIFDFMKIGNRWSVSEFYDRNNFLADGVLNLDETAGDDKNEWRKQADLFLDKYQSAPFYYGEQSSAPSFFVSKKFSRRAHFKFFHPEILWHSISWYLKDFINYCKDKHRGDYSRIKPWFAIWDKLKIKVRILFYPNHLFENVENLKEDYAYFPLQSEPEGHPMLLAPFYNDQLWLVKQIARSLPLHYKLYVKDHPAMIGFRENSFYKKIKNIPNVRLVHPSCSGYNLIKNSRLIFSLTGSSGWEGVLLKKPVIVFGGLFFNKLSAVRECKHIDELPYLVDDTLKNFVYNERELRNFLAIAFKESVELDLIKIWDYDGGGNFDLKKKAVAPMVDFIYSKCRIKNNL